MNAIARILPLVLVIALLLGGIAVAVEGDGLQTILADAHKALLGEAAERADAEETRTNDARDQAAAASETSPTDREASEATVTGQALVGDADLDLEERRKARNADPPPPTIDRQFQAEIEEYLGSQGGLYGLALRNMDTGKTVLVNADDDFPSASTYKVLVMYRVYELFDAGELTPHDILTITERDGVEWEPYDGLFPGDTATVGEALEAMITLSSNAAARALVRLTGGWTLLDATAVELGMDQTGMEGEYYWTTPADMLLFFEALARGRLVSEGASDEMMQLLRRQTIDDRIPALLPEGTFVAHKTGELPELRNDAGIVEGPGGGFVICAFSRWVHEGEAVRVIAEVSRRAYDRYAR